MMGKVYVIPVYDSGVLKHFRVGVDDGTDNFSLDALSNYLTKEQIVTLAAAASMFADKMIKGEL